MGVTDTSVFTIRPCPEIVAGWADALVPERDSWYWDESPLPSQLEGCEVMNRAEYLADPVYSGIPYVNAYWHWRMPKTVAKVISSPQAWIAQIDADTRARVVAKQVELDRGLIFPRTHFDAIPDVLASFVVDDRVVISGLAWQSVEPDAAGIALTREMMLWDDVECLPLPPDLPNHIGNIANGWGVVQGANCLGTTAFCITADEYHRDAWVHQPEFIDVLNRSNYATVASDEPLLDDVLVFRDNDDVIIHAAYCLGNDRFLNKNGQSMFNPLRVVNRAMLDADWPGTSAQVCRRSALQSSSTVTSFLISS